MVALVWRLPVPVSLALSKFCCSEVLMLFLSFGLTIVCKTALKLIACHPESAFPTVFLRFVHNE